MTIAFNWKEPDYVAVFAERLKRLEYLRARPELLSGVRAWYRANPWDFIQDWGMTYDPRNVGTDKPSAIPFMLFPKQLEWLKWVVERWKAKDPGLTEKSRDFGVSWLAVSLGATLCLFYDGMAVGYGSRLEDLVDEIGNPDSLFWKARFFINNLPAEFRPGFNEKTDAPHMRVIFRATGSTMVGNAGDNIGRGGRTALFFVDEAAHVLRPKLIDASLSATTNCRIDVSSANGIGNPFYQKRQSFPAHKVFTMHWRDDPRKDDAWYAKFCEDNDPVTVAQEVDINYTASQTGTLIPSAWIQAAVDADKVLGISPRGEARGALDVADEGIDLNAFCAAHGIVVEDVVAWSGKGDDIFGTVQEAFRMADEHGIATFEYDADGLGAGVRGDARVINEQRALLKVRPIAANPFRGSGAVFKPESVIPSAIPGTTRERLERKNGDFFLNAKAQGWWELRVRFQRTFRAVNRCLEFRKTGETWALEYNPDDLIVLRSGMPALAKLTTELSQPTYTQTTAGKILVDKTPEGTRSPNYADAVMIRFSPRKTSFLAYLKT